MEIEDREALGFGTGRHLLHRDRVDRERNAEIAAAGAARLIADTALRRQPAQPPMLLRQDGHIDLAAEGLERLPESVHRIKEGRHGGRIEGVDTSLR